MENVMPTIKKTSDYRPRGPQNQVKTLSNVAFRFQESEIGEILRKKERVAGKSSHGESQAGIPPVHQACRLLPSEIRRTGPLMLMVADDHPVVREGLITMIDRQSDMRVVAQASTGREAVDKFLTLRPDVGLLDLRMPVM